MKKRGEVWTANLNPGRGTEPGKTRPVVILQNQSLLDCEHPSTVIIPMTTRLIAGAEPLRLRLRARERLLKDSDVLIDQIRAIDNQRLIDGPLTSLTSTEMKSLLSFVTEILT
jgi:mRNA interferase MazF